MSKLQDQIRRRVATKSYSAGFETYKARPVYLVQCFTYQFSNFSLVDNPHLIRTVPAYRTERISDTRRWLAKELRELRGKGLTRADVQRMARSIINAPASYGGKLSEEARIAVRAELLAITRKAKQNTTSNQTPANNLVATINDTVFERAKRVYVDGSVCFTTATEADYDYALGTVPPQAYGKHGFLMGEPWSSNSRGEQVWHAFFLYPNGNGACALMTEAQFRDIDAGHRATS